jgi:hypothetical protein
MSSFTNATSQTLPTPGTNRATEETDVRLLLAYLLNFLITFTTSNNRLTGGTGFDSDNIADKSITGKHVSANIKRAAQPSVEVGFGSTAATIFSLVINIPIINADVILNALCRVETFLAFDNLFSMNIQRSPDNITWTTISESVEQIYCSAANYNFRWKKLSCDNFVDVVPSAGLWYYRVTVEHQRNNTTIPATTGSATTVTLPTVTRSWFTAEWRNQRQP